MICELFYNYHSNECLVLVQKGAISGKRFDQNTITAKKQIGKNTKTIKNINWLLYKVKIKLIVSRNKNQITCNLCEFQRSNATL